MRGAFVMEIISKKNEKFSYKKFRPYENEI